MSDAVRLDVYDEVPLSTLYREREEARLETQQRLTVDVDLSEEGLAKSAEAAKDAETPPATDFSEVIQQGLGRIKLRQMTGIPKPPTGENMKAAMKALKGGTPVTPKRQEISVEDGVAAFAQNPTARGIADTVLKTLTGGQIGFDDLTPEGIVRNTNQGKQIDPLKLLDPAGNTVEELARRHAKLNGMPEELVDNFASIAGLLGGFYLPFSRGAKAVKGAVKGAAAKLGKAGKVAEDVAGGEKVGINLARVDATTDVKATMGAISQLHADRLTEARKTVTHAQTVEESQRLGLTLEDAASLNVEKYDLRPVQMALRDYHNAAAKHVDTLFRAAMRGDEDAAVQLNYAFTVAGDLSVRDELLGKMAARGLEARKIASQAERAPFSPEQIAALTDLMGGAVPTTRDELVQRGMTLARRLNGLSKEQRRALERGAVQMAREGRTNVLYEAWLNWGLLSGPQTHLANITSNTATTLWAPGERLLAAVASAVETGVTLGRHERSVYFGESAAMLYGMTQAMRDGVRLAGKAMRTGSSEFGPDKVELGLDAARRAFTQGDDTAGDAIGFWAAAFRGPTRALTAEDAFFKTVNYRAELYAQAYREAASEGLQGKAFAARVREMVASPPAVVEERAKQFALTQTFNREVQELGWVGESGGGMLKGVRKVPFVGPLAAPFMRTPVNIMHYASERTPLLNALSDTLRTDIKAGGAPRAEALGKVTAGALLGWGVMDLAANGLITGGGPTNPAERRMWEDQDGRKPYSVRLGDQWVSFNRFDPIGTMMGTVADAMEIMSRLPQHSPYSPEIATAIALAFSRNMVSKTYLEGISSLFETFTDPDRNLLDIPRDVARTTVPSFLRTLERSAVDPAIRERRVPRERFDEASGTFENDPWAEVNTLLNEIRAQIPGLSDTLPPMRNRWGEVVTTPPGVGPDLLSPIYSSAVKDDPVAKELARLRLGLSKPRPVVFGSTPPQMAMGGVGEEHGVELNPEEYDRLVVLAGQGGAAPNPGALAGMPSFREALAQAMQTTEYREAGDGGKRLVLRRLDEAYKKAARGQLMQESPGLVDLIGEKLRLRGESLKPSGTLPSTLGR